MMESPEVLREPAVAVPQSQSRRSDGTQSAARPRFTVEEVSDDTPRSTLPQAVAATTPHHNIATPHIMANGSGAGAMEDDSDDAAPR